MKKFLLLLMGLTILSCSEDKQEDCCVVVDMAVKIKYLDSQGNNLLETEDGIKASGIAVYHKVEDEWIRYYRGNLDHPTGVRIDEREDGPYLSIGLSDQIVQDSYSETKIEFSKDDADVIRAEIDLNYSNMIVTKVWYNDELKWEAYKTERMFEIIK